MSKQQELDFSILWKKIQGQLSEEEETQLHQWLQKSADNQAYFEQLKQHFDGQETINFIDQERTDKAWERVNTKLSTRKNNKPRIGYWAAAASIVLILSVLFIQYSWEQHDTPIVVENQLSPGSDQALLIMSDGKKQELGNGETINLADGKSAILSDGSKLVYNANQQDIGKENTVIIPRGGKYELQLADGTKVWLNSETKLTYPVSFNTQERIVKLEGEAYFDVTSDVNRPFRVISPEQTVTVLGTSFNVQAYQETNKTITTLVEGKVAVNIKNSELETTLSPNMQSTFSRINHELNTKVVDTDLYTGWKDGLFIFEDARLEDMLMTLSRWYDMELFYQNEAQKDLKFTGEMKRHDGLKKILKLIEKTNTVEFTIKGKTVIVK